MVSWDSHTTELDKVGDGKVAVPWKMGNRLNALKDEVMDDLVDGLVGGLIDGLMEGLMEGLMNAPVED